MGKSPVEFPPRVSSLKKGLLISGLKMFGPDLMNIVVKKPPIGGMDRWVTDSKASVLLLGLCILICSAVAQWLKVGRSAV